MPRVKVKYLGSAGLSNLVKNRITKVRKKASNNIVKYWQEQAFNSNVSARAKARIARNIKPYSLPRIGAYIDDYVASILDTGWKKFDMKPGLLRGQRWRVIPLKTRFASRPIFRTVSVKSPPKSWIHPGYRGARSRAKVQRSIARIVKEAIND